MILSDLKIKEIPRQLLVDYLSNVSDPVNQVPSRVTAFGGFFEGKLISVVCLYKGFWHTTEIRCLNVLPEYRNNGIGSLMVSHALKGVTTPAVMATVKKGNVASEKIFQKLNFVPCVEFLNKNTGNKVRIWIRRK